MTQNIAIRGIRQTIPSGYVLGRLSAGSGQPELIPFQGFTSNIAPYIVSISQGAILVAGAGIHKSNGTLTVNWNAGTVNALGTGLAISAASLVSDWQVGSVTAIGTGLSLSAGHTLSATALPVQWNAGTVNALGTVAGAGTLSITANTLTASFPAAQWTAGTISTTGVGIVASGGTLSALPPFASWSPTDFAAGGSYNAPTLSNNNLTIVQSGVSGNQWTVDRATIPQTTGKFYVEFTINAGASNNGAVEIGVIQSASALTIGSGSAGAWWWANNGSTALNGAAGASINTWLVNGNRMDIALDLTVTPIRIWGRVNGGNWNNSGAANPATNVGGIDISALSVPLSLFFWTDPFSGTQPNVTMNAGQSGMTGTVPVGFVAGWPYSGLTGGVGATGATGPTIWNAGSVTAIAGSLSLASTTLTGTGLTHAQVMARANVGWQ